MEQQFNYAMEIGEQMLISGAEVHRVEESVKRMCTAFGAERVDVFIITTSMVVTLHTPIGQTLTQTRRIAALKADYEKLHQLNQLSRHICEGTMSNEEISAALKEIAHVKTYPLWLEYLCYAGIAAAFTLFFGGLLAETAVSFLIGGVVRLGMGLTRRAVHNNIFIRFCSAVIATALAFLAVQLTLIPSIDKVIIGNIMTLIPGIGLTNALRDLFAGDSIAGLLRSIEAVLTALAIAAGYVLVAILGGVAL